MRGIDISNDGGGVKRQTEVSSRTWRDCRIAKEPAVPYRDSGISAAFRGLTSAASQLTPFGLGTVIVELRPESRCVLFCGLVCCGAISCKYCEEDSSFSWQWGAAQVGEISIELGVLRRIVELSL